MLEQRMYTLISQAMERVTSGPVDVRFQVLDATVDPASHGMATPRPLASPAAEALPTVSTNGQHEFPQRPATFNSRFTFETFIVGSSNELAHAAASAVADSPGHVYNPLVIYSDVGLGKTHLLHAVGQRIQAKGLPLIYATAEEFTNEYIKAIREGKTEEFRNRYRGAGALLLDDIQFLIGKEQTQEGFFHTFNALHLSNRQVVITSDRPVSALTLLEDRIQSRLAGGLVVDIQAPDFETRVAILRAKADLMGQHLDDKVLEMLS
ncbi:MAG: ATP-binding protein, partial [Chloroflexi bacterium]|nr:ATP-binding protein [Chloroflexota bacterium]